MAAILNFEIFLQIFFFHLEDTDPMNTFTKNLNSSRKIEAARKSLKVTDATEELIRQKTFLRPHPPLKPSVLSHFVN